MLELTKNIWAIQVHILTLSILISEFYTDLKTALFWVITQRVVVISYQEITTTRCTVLIYFAAQAWNHTFYTGLSLVVMESKVFSSVPTTVSTWCFSDRASWIDYILVFITNLMHWLLFIHKILFSSTCFESQVLIFRRIQLYRCNILYCHSLWEFLVACRYTAWVRIWIYE